MFNMAVYRWCCVELKRWGVDDPASSMVLYGMVGHDLDYGEACSAYGEYEKTDGHLVHSGICYHLIAAGCSAHPGTLFRYLKWRGREENADRISAGQGS